MSQHSHQSHPDSAVENERERANEPAAGAALTAAVAQFAPGADPEANLESVARLVRRARAAGARLVVLPEYSSAFAAPFGPETAGLAQPLDGAFAHRVAALAGAHGMWVVAGMLETAPSGRVHNTVIALGPDGERHALYRKLHLYDAFGNRESDWVEPGEPLAPEILEIDGLRVGLMTCYDLRFPESARVLTDAGAEVILVPAQWVPGPNKEYHWQTLLAARAIENTAYVVGAGQIAPAGVGLSAILDPAGLLLAGAGVGEGIAIAELSAERLAHVRAQNPALTLRRYRVSPGRR